MSLEYYSAIYKVVSIVYYTPPIPPMAIDSTRPIRPPAPAPPEASSHTKTPHNNCIIHHSNKYKCYVYMLYVNSN